MNRFLLLAALRLTLAHAAERTWGDLGDGRYRNPILKAVRRIASIHGPRPAREAGHGRR